jgi:hypothetical protein
VSEPANGHDARRVIGLPENITLYVRKGSEFKTCPYDDGNGHGFGIRLGLFFRYVSGACTDSEHEWNHVGN